MTKFEPLWIVGFVDGEGCFGLDVHYKEDMKYKIQVQPEFTVVQIEQDRQVLDGLKEYFGVGNVSVNRTDQTSTRLHYRTKNVDHMATVIIPFFEKHKLKTKKGIEMSRLRKIVLLMQQKHHTNSLKGLLEIIDLGAAIRVPVVQPQSTIDDGGNKKKASKKRNKVEQQIEILRALYASNPEKYSKE